ncbi:hypothetical protein E2562_002621 [Oryza meyeriana var. granulata]|uniref:Uncharacterized protein n=1 Tax=Oryza meyeriana var. granulata TaxID=110450 RepID=A0A6G1F319_9ORYZ|nr:hypothetical protein E2562_002621 [Oryza meyeriana var. granulata]
MRTSPANVEMACSTASSSAMMCGGRPSIIYQPRPLQLQRDKAVLVRDRGQEFPEWPPKVGDRRREVRRPAWGTSSYVRGGARQRWSSRRIHGHGERSMNGSFLGGG